MPGGLIDSQNGRNYGLQPRILKRPQAIPHPLCIPPISNEADLLQGRHVARHAGLADAQFRHHFAQAMFLTPGKQTQGATARRVGKGGKKGIKRDHATYMHYIAYAVNDI